MLRQFFAVQIVYIIMDETVQKMIEQSEKVGEVNSGMKGNFVPPYGLFGFIQPDLQIFAFLEVGD